MNLSEIIKNIIRRLKPDAGNKGPKDHRKSLGDKGERIAERFLKRKGFKVSKRNLRYKAGEIDLLMIDKEDLVIVEVRTIQDKGELALEDRVPYRKRQQLIRLANYLIAELDDPLPPIRFDICVVVMEPSIEVHHYKDAFRSDEIGRQRY
ncbi:MAG: YraN family protein [Candidatus Electryonea clarkiae]|nr:YraN family protein [Candidatus Electryonea clarkiae]MDP8287072.1 YraN family protein [Candidatus Electryonea clarkiae]